MAHNTSSRSGMIVSRPAQYDDSDGVTIFERSAPVLAICLFLVTVFTTALSFFMQ